MHPKMSESILYHFISECTGLKKRTLRIYVILYSIQVMQITALQLLYTLLDHDKTDFSLLFMFLSNIYSSVEVN